MGINVEDLNLRTDAKLLMMFAIVIIAYVLSIQLGGTPLGGTPLGGTPLDGTPLGGTPLGLENKVKHMKKYKNKPKYISVSYFRQGLSILKLKAWNFKKFKKFLIDVFRTTHQGHWLYVQ